MSQNEIDDVSGTETTGHEWDGIKELNTPMPRWWINTFYLTVIWGIGYMIMYPAIPLISSYTPGLLKQTNRGELVKKLDEASKAQQGLVDKIKAKTVAEIRADQELLSFAQAGGEAAYKINCVQCHGAGAEGAKGAPNLNDDDWLWGGKIEDVYATIKHGIRFESDDDTRVSEMPAFGRDELLTKDQIAQVAKFVQTLSSGKPDAAGPGAALYKEHCAACHGDSGQGDREQGAAKLSDQIWLYGGDLDTITKTITNSRNGVMPAWAHRLDDVTIKQLAIYVHTLGGGE